MEYNFKFSDLKICNAEQTNNPYSIHNLKILIITLLAKIMEKTHLSNNFIDLEGTIIKRKFKKKIIKNNNINNKNEKKKKKKKKPIINEIPIINVDIINNKKVNIITINENKNKNENENNERKCILKPSKTDIIKGTFNLLKDIIKGKLTINKYKKIADTYIKYNKIDPLINNKRVCKTPFKKWYIKGYTNKSDSRKIVNFMLGFTKKQLNKNLIVKLNNSSIININYI
jgi:hypothetical protein